MLPVIPVKTGIHNKKALCGQIQIFREKALVFVQALMIVAPEPVRGTLSDYVLAYHFLKLMPVRHIAMRLYREKK